MAQIVINEISQNYTYNIGNNSFATVALPITACWGPGYIDPRSLPAVGGAVDYEGALEATAWQRFPATQAGLESFVTTFRGPRGDYRQIKDYSYQTAMTLLTAGYDVLVCRLTNGGKATKTENITYTPTGGSRIDVPVTISAKYPGTFGNNLQYRLSKISDGDNTYWNMIIYVVDSTGVRTAVENLKFVFTEISDSDAIQHYSELESNFVAIDVSGSFGSSKDADLSYAGTTFVSLEGGADSSTYPANSTNNTVGVIDIVKQRFAAVGLPVSSDYITKISTQLLTMDAAEVSIIGNREWLLTALVGFGANQEGVLDLLKDKLTYNPQRLISPGWDDQDYKSIGADITRMVDVSPLHIKMLDVAYYSRCATALIDVPRSCPRGAVHNESHAVAEEGYAQKLSRYIPQTTVTDLNQSLYSSHDALFAPWRQYTFVGMNKQVTASPAFVALMIQRAMILNQPLQYEWAQPTNRKHRLNIGKPDYIVTKKLMDAWQKTDGVHVNAIVDVPDLGTTIWGNSTLFELPPATYQALANLSTRYLVNAVEDLAYRCGIGITYQYNNDQAYNKFYAGMTPLLDTMKQVGAIDDYYIRMSADINGLDQVNANTVIGKVYLVINGIVNDIFVDLIALPPSVSLDQFRA